MVGTSKLAGVLRTLVKIVLAAAFAAIVVFDVVTLALLMVNHLGLPLDIALLLSGAVLVGIVGLSEVVVWVVYRLITFLRTRLCSRNPRQEARSNMSQFQLASLMNQMNALQIDSLEARKALIQESFNYSRGTIPSWADDILEADHDVSSFSEQSRQE